MSLRSLLCAIGCLASLAGCPSSTGPSGDTGAVDSARSEAADTADATDAAGATDAAALDAGNSLEATNLGRDCSTQPVDFCGQGYRCSWGVCVPDRRGCLLGQSCADAVYLCLEPCPTCDFGECVTSEEAVVLCERDASRFTGCRALADAGR